MIYIFCVQNKEGSKERERVGGRFSDLHVFTVAMTSTNNTKSKSYEYVRRHTFDQPIDQQHV